MAGFCSNSYRSLRELLHVAVRIESNWTMENLHIFLVKQKMQLFVGFV